MLMEDHERFHKLSPKDVGLQNVMPLQLSRTTAETGESFTFEVPIYPDDSREMVNDRVNFALSIMQDRLEDVNKAMVIAREKAQKAQHARAVANKVRALEKRLRKGKITQEAFDKEVEALDENFADAMAAVELEGKSDDEVLSEDSSEEEVDKEA